MAEDQMSSFQTSLKILQKFYQPKEQLIHASADPSVRNMHVL